MFKLKRRSHRASILNACPINRIQGNADIFPPFLRVQASDSPLSGLVAMLVAMQILTSDPGRASSYSRQLAFAVIPGEPWDLMGSRRLLWEMARGSPSTAGLDLDLIDQVWIQQSQLALGISFVSAATTNKTDSLALPVFVSCLIQGE